VVLTESALKRLREVPVYPIWDMRLRAG